ncbi:MAG: polysaccharide deacetylase family protein, partial [Pseudobdellovibrionaceae bacterium]
MMAAFNHFSKKIQLGIFLLLGFFLQACSPSFSVKNKVQQATEANQTAATYNDYIISEAHPERLFEQMHQRGATDADSRELCEVLQNLSKVQLSLFEEEIKKTENEVLVSGCKSKLIEDLNNYFSEQVNQLVQISNNSSSTKFSNKVLYRDTSQGYRALTGDVGPKELVLTFDDGPSPEYSEKILKALDDVNAKAIFFQLGKSVEAHPEITRKIGQAGHAVGSHSYSHKCLASSSACRRTNGFALNFDQAVEEIRRGHQSVLKALGWVMPFFRFPYGESSPELSAYLRKNGIAEFYWKVDSNDWRAQSLVQLLEKT